MKQREQYLRCPSVQPASEDSHVFGVVGGTVEQPQVAYLKRPQPATEELLALAQPADPGEVFRFEGPCVGPRCPHFNLDTETCQLATRVSQQLPSVVDKLPVCAIRSQCVWWHQEGPASCMRCPQVVTNPSSAPSRWREVAWSDAERRKAQDNERRNSRREVER